MFIKSKSKSIVHIHVFKGVLLQGAEVVMAEYDDYRLTGDEECAKINEELGKTKTSEERADARMALPVYLTDDAHRAAQSCFSAAQGCVFLLDYATTAEEKKLLRYAADALNGLYSALGGGRKISGAEQFGSSGVRRALKKTFLLCNDASMKICMLAESSGGDALLSGFARTAMCVSQSVLAVYVMQI